MLVGGTTLVVGIHTHSPSLAHKRTNTQTCIHAQAHAHTNTQAYARLLDLLFVSGQHMLWFGFVAMVIPAAFFEWAKYKYMPMWNQVSY